MTLQLAIANSTGCFSEDLVLILGTLAAGDLILSSVSSGTCHFTWYIDIHVGKTPIHIKTKKKEKLHCYGLVLLKTSSHSKI